VSRRARAVGFACAAGLCAALAAAATGGAGSTTELGELRPVVVATATLPAHRSLTREMVASALEVRRVPERFLAPDALADPSQALGRRPAATIPAGGYLVASQLQPLGDPGRARGPRLLHGLHPVEITVAGAGALAQSPRAGPGRTVDVVVTSEPSTGAGAGRTFVAARAVRLLDLRPQGANEAPVDPTAGDAWVATLALTRSEALRLIHAQSFAREVRLIGR
jgi:Flp pilus assembly protein CpaB